MTDLSATNETTRTEIADYLREFADQLDPVEPIEEGPPTGTDPADRRVTFMVGNDSTTINPPNKLEFEVAVDSDADLLGGGEDRVVEFQLTWAAEAVDDGDGSEPLEIR